MQEQDTRSHPPRNSMLRDCERCQSPFYAPLKDVRRGFGRFCSRTCARQRDLATSVSRKIGPPTGTGCRPWLAAHDADGYGFITVQYRLCRATHAVWFLHTGHWPTQDEVIAHLVCDWPPCCEFSHLGLTDHAGNMADRQRKSRQMRGERQHKSKLTAAIVIEMRRAYLAGGTHTAIGRQHGVSYATARSAILGETWKHVTATPPPR
jgi:hypothetical protein